MNPQALENFIITGAEGMIGRAIPWGKHLNRSTLDVTDSEIINRLGALKPAGIIHLASPDIRQCESDSSLVEKHLKANTLIAQYAAKAKIPLVYLSSGAIFSGGFSARFCEESKPNPLHAYGRLKYESEKFFLKYYPNTLIIRSGWVFGGHGANHKKFVDLCIENALAGRPIRATADQEGSPTFVADLVLEMNRLLLADEVGTIHVVNHGVTTAFDMAQFIVAKLKSTSKIEGIKTSQLENNKIPRSPSEALISNKIKLRSWQLALSEYLLQSRSNHLKIAG